MIHVVQAVKSKRESAIVVRDLWQNPDNKNIQQCIDRPQDNYRRKQETDLHNNYVHVYILWVTDRSIINVGET